MKIYGIKTCDTVSKARAWLETRGIDHVFVDFRVDGLDPKLLDRWTGLVGWQTLLNRSSTTFRELPEAKKSSLDERSAEALMLAHPTLIKRPVLDLADRVLVGFKPAVYEAAIGESRQ